jgi:UDP-3-O-[3-hydroxymyristoyl] glucosamine N-acyltransferase
MTFTLQELATMSGGELVGDPALRITGAASLAEAVSGEIAFFSDPRYRPHPRRGHRSDGDHLVSDRLDNALLSRRAAGA